MSAALVIRPCFLVLETVQATAASAPFKPERSRKRSLQLVRACPPETCPEEPMQATQATPLRPSMVDQAGYPFYRKYTEGMLRRYGKLSMESGRVPSMLGQEMFRGKVTNYKVHGFDDVVIFVHDVERCLKGMTLVQQHLLERIVLQGYTQGETAALLGISLRTVVRRYNAALDDLTRLFLKKKMLQPLSAGAQG